MRLLVLGTSDAGALLRAHTADPSILGRCCSAVGFVAVPGGTGPNMRVDGDRLAIGHGGAADQSAFRWPASLEVGRLCDWDALVISALGLVDTGFAYEFFGVQQGLLFDCQPRPHDRLMLLSRACCKEVVSGMLQQHAGVTFARALRAATGARLIIQPTPLLSSDMIHQEGWPLARLYDDPRRANQFFTEARMDFLTALAAELSADLLPFPDPAWRETGFTPASLMDARDGVHGNDAYGRLVLAQIAYLLQRDTGLGRRA